MKKNSIFKILGLCILFIFIISYIFPTATNESAQMEYMPIWAGLKYPLIVLEYFSSTPLFLLVVGGLYGVLNKTGLYDNIVNMIEKKYNKSKDKFVLITFVIMTLLSSMTKIGLGLFIIIPFLISIVRKLKYDKIVAFMATFGAILIGNVSNVFNYNIIAGTLDLYQLSVFDTILIRLVMLIGTLSMAGMFLCLYIKNSANKEEKSKDDNISIQPVVKKEMNKKNSGCKFVIITMISVMVFAVLASFPWEHVFDTTIFTDINNTLNDIKINGELSIFSQLISAQVIGYYGITDYMVLMFLVIVILKFTLKITLDDVIDGFVEGLKTMIKPLFALILVYVVLILGTYHPTYNYFVDGINSSLTGFNLFKVSIMTILMSIFNVDINIFVSTLVQMLSTNITDSNIYPLLSVLISSLYGVIMIIVPSSITLVLGLVYMDISYSSWIKYIWKTFVGIFVFIFSILLIWTLYIVMFV